MHAAYIMIIFVVYLTFDVHFYILYVASFSQIGITALRHWCSDAVGQNVVHTSIFIEQTMKAGERE